MKKNKKGQSAIIAMSVGVIILAIILGVIFNFITTEATTISSVPNETITFTSATVAGIQVLANDDLASFDALTNITGENILTTVGCNVTLSTGTIGCNATGSTTGFAEYTFFPDGYITSAPTRTLMNLVPVLAALAVLLFVFAFVAMKGK